MSNSLREIYLFPQLITYKLFSKQIYKKTKVILIGTPIHKNLGDHLIAHHEREFIMDSFKNAELIEIPTEIFVLYKSLIQSIINPEDIIFITGGGWLGDVWIDDDLCMQEIINTFKNNNITILPQTLYFNNLNSYESNELLESAKSIYKNSKRLCLLLRDEKSIENAKSYYGNCAKKIGLFPDMALYKDLKNSSCNKSGFLFCLREDIEKESSGVIEKEIYRFAKENNIEVSKTSTISKHSVPIWLRKNKIVSKSREFSKAKVVVTDRLHGMIFALLSGTKCVAIDNKTHKVFGVYKKWLSDNNNVFYVDKKYDKKSLYEFLNSEFDAINHNNWRNKINKSFNKLSTYLEEN